MIESAAVRRRLVAAAVAATAALAVVAPLAASATPPNGITSLPPEQVAPMVQQAAESARSVHLTTVSPDFRDVDSVGRNVASSLHRFGSASFALRRIGDEMWWRPNAAYWHAVDPPREADREITAQAGRWIQAYQGAALFRFYRHDLYPDTLMHVVVSFPDHLVRISGRVVDGRPTYGITGESHGDEDYAATHGQPYPLLLISHPGDEPVYRQRLSDWNVPITVDAPPSDNVITWRAFVREAYGQPTAAAATLRSDTIR